MKILHVLSQRPMLTGSGVTLDALLRCATAAGYEQAAIAGVPVTDTDPQVGGLPNDRIFPLRFGGDDLPFPVPGMSDVMPYQSSRWSELTEDQLAAYRNAWQQHVKEVLERFQPDLVHSHHIWILSSMLKDLVPKNVPVVTHCHATGLRQLELCPHLKEEVITKCRRNDAFFVLHGQHKEALAETLAIDPESIHVIGAGYREETFFATGEEERDENAIAYAGKLSRSKGLAELLDAFEQLHHQQPNLRLHIAGSGAGSEADQLRARIESLAPQVVFHGRLEQPQLADLLRRVSLFVLPSFYEGLPLVLVEALACGCRLVATRLSGVEQQIAPSLEDALQLVDPPRLVHTDQPVAAEIPRFVADLKAAIQESLARQPLDVSKLEPRLMPFRFQAVFERVERVWR